MTRSGPKRTGDTARDLAYPARMTDFGILVVEGTNPSGVAMTRDILEAARLFALRSGKPAPTWAFHSPDGGTVRLQGGLSIETRRLPDRVAPRSVRCVSSGGH